MRKFRYRTSVLTGPWRDSPTQALRDAVRSRQVRFDSDDPRKIHWFVPGRIEENTADLAPQPPPRLAWQ